MPEIRNVYIGWDGREHEAYNVTQASILRRSKNILIHPLRLDLLHAHIKRPIEKRDNQLWCPISNAPMSTEFAISRFTVPFIQREGWAVFADCDMVCLADINELFDLADDKYAVMVVKHAQESGDKIKMDGQQQTYYDRKNWSSVMLMNCSHPSHLKLRSCDRINKWPGRDLHAFKWLEDDEIGEIPKEWNYLVNVDPPEEASQAKLLHFTLGSPALPNWEPAPFDNIYLTERMMTYAC